MINQLHEFIFNVLVPHEPYHANCIREIKRLKQCKLSELETYNQSQELFFENSSNCSLFLQNSASFAEVEVGSYFKIFDRLLQNKSIPAGEHNRYILTSGIQYIVVDLRALGIL
jgi:hypothetical protein